MVVYHYCSLDTFRSIIENRTLRLSDITKSNDSAEIVWAAGYINEILLDLYRKDSTILLHEGFPEKLLQEMIDHFYAEWFSEEHSIYRLYAICFSKKGDLLSQWRGYADDAAGVALGIDTTPLFQLCDGGVFNLEDVIYNETRQKALIKGRASDFIKDLKQLVRSEPSDIKKSNMELFDTLFRKVYKFSPFLKSPFFAEEQEHRLVLWDSKDHVSVTGENFAGGFRVGKLQYLSSDGWLRGYTDLSFSEVATPLIKEVILGPKCKAKIKDVQGFLMCNNLYGVQVTESRGTYR